MLSIISLVLFGIVYVSSDDTDTATILEGDDNIEDITTDSKYKKYNKFLSDDIYDCQCTTGHNTEQLDIDCDSDYISQYIQGLEEYITSNKCNQYCSNQKYIGSTKEAFRCFQAFTLLIQYHVYCPSKSANETLFHQYLTQCPDCLETHHQAAYAPECDSSLNCTDIDDQEAEILFVTENCIQTCFDTDCEESWQIIEAYHRLCPHTEITEEFDTIYDGLSFVGTACLGIISCNVPWEANYVVDCELNVNHGYKEMLSMYGKLDLIEDIGIKPTKDAAIYHFNIFVVFVAGLSLLLV